MRARKPWLAALCLAGVLAVATAQAAMAGASATVAKRVVSLAPHVTELIFAAGAGDRIVGTVNSSDYPAAARAIPKIGDGMNVDPERVLALRPDLVIAWQPTGAALTLKPILDRLGIPLIYSEPRALADIPAETRRFGRLLGTAGAASAAASQLDDRLAMLARHYAGRAERRVFLEVGSEPLYTIGSDPLLNDALRICGGKNLYADSAVAAPQVSAESVLVNKPDAVIVPATDPARVESARRRWASLHLEAAIRHHVYGIDPDALFRPGPRLVDATETLCKDVDAARSESSAQP